MVQTIRDLDPLFDYARIVTKESIKSPIKFLVNYFEEVDTNKIRTNVRPRLIKFGSSLYIEGSSGDVIFGSAFVKAHPDALYYVFIYEDPEIAADRFKSVYGHPYEALEYKKVTPRKVEPFKEVYEDGLQKLFEMHGSSDVEVYLRSYLLNFDPDVMRECPCLIGHTGIAKSSIVKLVISKLDVDINLDSPPDNINSNPSWGFRMVDIKAGFLDKVDLLGFVERETYKGKAAWSDAPKKDFLSCTKSFVLQCRKTLQECASNKVVTKDPEKNQKVLERLAHFAKTPVLFYDEITRSPKEIMYQVMNTISEHKLGNYDLSIAPTIAAANTMEEEDKIPMEKQPLLDYLTTKLGLAEAKRFSPLRVVSTDVSIISNAYEYLKKEFGKSKLATDAIEWAKSKNKLYDLTSIDQFGKFACLRGWEDTCKYLSYMEFTKPDDEISRQVIQGSLGTNIEPKDFIKNRKIGLDTTSDNFIQHSLDAGLPVALLGKLGIAKTCKLAQYARDHQHVLFNVNLSATDKCTVLGNPDKQKFTEALFNNLTMEENNGGKVSVPKSIDAKDTDVFKKFSDDCAKDPTIPKSTTEFLPNAGMLRNIDECRPHCSNCGWERADDKYPLSHTCPNCGKNTVTWKKMVLNFDEFNHCNPILQSSIFEAISEKRYQGASLEGCDYTVVATGNWENPITTDDTGGVYGVEKTDTATLHRFCSKMIEKIDESELAGFMNYLSNKAPKFYKTLEAYAGTSKSKLLEMLNYMPDPTEEITITTPVLTYRDIEQMNNISTMFNFPILGLLYTNIQQSFHILQLPNYILRGYDPSRTIAFKDYDESIMNPFRSIYRNINTDEIKLSDICDFAVGKIKVYNEVVTRETQHIKESLNEDRAPRTERGRITEKLLAYIIDVASKDIDRSGKPVDEISIDDIQTLKIETYKMIMKIFGVSSLSPDQEAAINKDLVGLAKVAYSKDQTLVKQSLRGLINKVDSVTPTMPKSVEPVEEPEATGQGAASSQAETVPTESEIKEIINDHVIDVVRGAMEVAKNPTSDAVKDSLVPILNAIIGDKLLANPDIITNHMSTIRDAALADIGTNVGTSLSPDDCVRTKNSIITLVNDIDLSNATLPKVTLIPMPFTKPVQAPTKAPEPTNITTKTTSPVTPKPTPKPEPVQVPEPISVASSEVAKWIGKSKELQTEIMTMLSSVKYLESEIFDFCTKSIKDSTPEQFRGEIMTIMNQHYEEKTRDQLSASVVDKFDILDVSDIEENVATVLASFETDTKFKSKFMACVLKAVKDSHSKVPMSTIRKLIDVFNKHTFVSSVGQEFELSDLIELLDSATENIIIDKYEKIVFGEKDNNGISEFIFIINKLPFIKLSVKDRPGEQEEQEIPRPEGTNLTEQETIGKFLLERYIITEDNNDRSDMSNLHLNDLMHFPSVTAKAKMDKELFFPNVVPLKYKSFVPDLYSIKCMTGYTLEGDDEHGFGSESSVIFDDSVFKVKVTHLSGGDTSTAKNLRKDSETLLYQYTAKILWYEITINQAVFNVNPMFYHVNTQNFFPVFKKEDMEHLDKFAQCNVQEMIAVMKTQDTYGGKLEDIPYKDKDAISKVTKIIEANIDPSITSNANYESVNMHNTTYYELANIELLFVRKFIRIIDKFFIG